ncbi:MAG: class I SAM-dependent methyltransferase [Oscillospiraceae bacterium]|nr:class I SAM-dependent methyltransferase [Oscillospiraceae bacterium]
MNDLVNQENIKRFDGYSGLYNTSRPTPPEIITKAILKYLGKTPEIMVDIGSGTGLSTLIWKDIVKTIIGIEPNDDMKNEAEKNISAGNITFQKGVSNDTGLPDETADIITVSQAFHWFDIDSTLNEVFRVLKDGGVFAVFDCDWPPTVDWQVEKGFIELHKKCDQVNFKQETHAKRSDKTSTIKRFNEFGKFKFVKEIVCHSIETCNAERMKGIALSQGAMQTAMKVSKDIKADIDAFCALVDERCKGEFDIIFSYRLRLGIK